MKRSLLLLTLALACGPSTQTRQSAHCDFAAGTSACDGKTVKVNARASNYVAQHPRLSMDKQESYWEVNGNQWIFVSADTINCRSGVEAIGRLAARVGPCDPKANNKNQYCGTALYVDEWQCK